MGSIVAEIADKIASAGGGERSELEVRGGVGAAGGGILTLSTSELTVVDGDILGRIDFQAPLETGTDAIVVSASIYAEADDTFAADNNSTELVFAVGASEAAAEKMRLTHDGQLGIGTATPASLLHVEGTLQVGVDDAGHDVQFFGATTNLGVLWDFSEDELALLLATKLSFHDAAGGENIVASANGHLEINAGTTLDITAPTVDINASTGITLDGSILSTVIVGVDDTGYDVTFFGDAAGALMRWDASEDALLVRGATADHATTSAGRLVLQTNQAAVADGDMIGRIDFQPSGETGADALLVGASIYAEADATFDATTNATEIVFAVGDGAAVAEVVRIDHDGQLGIGVSTPASLLHVAGTVQVGVDGTGHDVKFFGDTSGSFVHFQQGADTLNITEGVFSGATTGDFSMQSTQRNTVANCTYSFKGDPDTGMIRNAANSLQLVTTGAIRFHVAATGQVAFGGATLNGQSLTQFRGSIHVGLGSTEQTSPACGHIFADRGVVTADNSAKPFKQLTASDGSLLVVNGQYASNRFTDLIMLSGPGSVSVLHTLNKQGSPGARTYSKSGENSFIAINDSSNNYNVSLTGMGANELAYTTDPALGS